MNLKIPRVVLISSNSLARAESQRRGAGGRAFGMNGNKMNKNNTSNSSYNSMRFRPFVPSQRPAAAAAAVSVTTSGGAPGDGGAGGAVEQHQGPIRQLQPLRQPLQHQHDGGQKGLSHLQTSQQQQLPHQQQHQQQLPSQNMKLQALFNYTYLSIIPIGMAIALTSSPLPFNSLLFLDLPTSCSLL